MVEFKIKGKRKKKVIVKEQLFEKHESVQVVKRELVEKFENGKVVVEKNELIIPLIHENWTAAASIMKDIKGNRVKDEIVIPAMKNENLFQQKVNDKPILMMNKVPMKEGEEDVFKVDVELRPSELNVNSQVYQDVPVEDFGAAMLRGMGWKGDSGLEEKKPEEKIQPRAIRLGLGATSHTLHDKRRKKKRKKKDAK